MINKIFIIIININYYKMIYQYSNNVVEYIVFLHILFINIGIIFYHIIMYFTSIKPIKKNKVKKFNLLTEEIINAYDKLILIDTNIVNILIRINQLNQSKLSDRLIKIQDKLININLIKTPVRQMINLMLDYQKLYIDVNNEASKYLCNKQ